MCVGQSKYLKNENNCKAVFLVYAVTKGISVRAIEGASALLGHGRGMGCPPRAKCVKGNVMNE